jgi:glycosyltransferase involved in cell wall biosynthesis
VAEKAVVGVILVRDEDVWVERVVRAVLDFCDELYLVDHRSRDATPQILERIAGERPDRVSYHRVDDSSVSHDLIAPYAGQDVWAFTVDGDELYEPERLRRFRERVLDGEFDDWWFIRGHTLHVTELDPDGTWARGHTSPPCPAGAKLFNFAQLERWDGYHPQRLNGTEGMVFKPGYGERKYRFNEIYTWDESSFRSLHFPFTRRSSLDRRVRPRKNFSDLNAPRRLPLRAVGKVRQAVGLPEQSDYKRKHYLQGPLVEVDARSFFPDEPPPRL